MGLLIDASALIDHDRGRLDLDSHLQGHREEEFFLSIVTASELLHGVHRARGSARRSRRSAWVERTLDRFPLLTIDLASARAHARLWAELAGVGRIIGPQDLLLAAACLAHGYILVTANVWELGRVQGLEIENWLSRETLLSRRALVTHDHTSGGKRSRTAPARSVPALLCREAGEVLDPTYFLALPLQQVLRATTRPSVRYHRGYSNVTKAKRIAAGSELHSKSAGKSAAGSQTETTSAHRRLRNLWARLILRGYEVDPRLCQGCSPTMRVLDFMLETAAIR